MNPRILPYPLTALLLFSSAHAEVIYVDSELNTGADDGSTWKDAFLDLQDAIAVSQNGDEIWVAKGIHYPDEGQNTTSDDASESFTIAKNISVYGGFLNGDGNLSDRDPEANLTVLSGDIQQNDGGDLNGDGVPDNTLTLVGTNSARVVTIDQVASGNNFDGFTITSGNGVSGCGMHITDSALTVKACRIVFNTASGIGGGVYITGDGMKFIGSIIDLNKSSGNGGGVYLDSAEMSFTDMLIRKNTAANRGGGVYSFRSVLNLVRTSAAFNSATSNGGGFYLETTSQRAVTLTDCRFDSNSSNNTGGGFHLRNALINATNCQFRGNTASPTSGFAGAMHFEDSTATFVNCAVTGNTAALSAGGLRSLSSTANVINCTFANNQANTLSAYGGAGSFFNCIFWDNHTANATSTDVGTSNTFSHCLVEFQDLSASGNNLNGTLAANDPLFEVPVTTPPSAGGIYRLLRDSPCLDRGNNATYSGPSLDLGGVDRFHDYDGNLSLEIDLGAYESQASADAPQDVDSDGLPDSYEMANTNPPSLTSLVPGGDPDLDNISTIVEFALGPAFDPNAFNAPPLILFIDASDRPVLNHPRSISAAAFVTLSLESSTDLGIADDWGPAPVTTSMAPPSGDTEVVIHTSTHTTGGVPETFYRLTAVKK